MKFIIWIFERNRILILRIIDFAPIWFQKRLKALYRSIVVQDHKRIQNYLKSKGKLISGAIFHEGAYKLHKRFHSPSGVNILGFTRGQFGLAQQLRNVGLAFHQSSIKKSYYSLDQYSTIAQSDNSLESEITQKLIYNTNIFVCNSDILPRLLEASGSGTICTTRYNIHYGAWELSKYPESWIYSLPMFEEYWAMSSFLQKSVSDIATIPVVHMPYPVDFETPDYITRKDFDLPEHLFLFMFSFDVSSIAARKNPEAVIRAFFQAFPFNKDVGLVIKVSSNKDLKTHQTEIRRIMEIANQDPRVHLINSVLSREKILGLINCCDVYVSLHRAEGFGIGMAEAMKMKKVVIATNYSGNTDFTLPDNSCLVDYKLIDIKPLEYIHEAGKIWADPMIDHAAYYMKLLFEDRELYNNLASNAKAYIDTHYNAKTIMQKYHERLKILGLVP